MILVEDQPFDKEGMTGLKRRPRTPVEEGTVPPHHTTPHHRRADQNGETKRPPHGGGVHVECVRGQVVQDGGLDGQPRRLRHDGPPGPSLCGWKG